MTKTTGHIVTSVFDAISIAALYWVYVEHSEVMASLSSTADIVSFNNRIYWALGMMLVPVVHIIAITEALWPKAFSKSINKPASIIVVVVLIGILILPFIVSNNIERNLLARGYVYCEEASFHGTISSTLVYVKNRALCSKDIDI
jgi:hypothetical protein